MKKKKAKRERSLTPEQEIALIENKMGYVTFERPKDQFNYLDLGNADANEALGDSELGIRWGSLIELFGEESHGKSLVSTVLAIMAQRADENVHVIKGDLELANNDRFNIKLGMDMSRFYNVKPKLAINLKDLGIKGKRAQSITQKEIYELMKKDKKKFQKQFAESGEQVCEKIEALVKYKRQQNPDAKFVAIIDSVTGMLVSEEDEAGLVDANMRTKVSLASFLSRLCRRWARFAENHNMIIIFINQIRTAPGVMFGNPEYTTGGKALKFFCNVRAKIRRVKDGKIKKNGEVIGIRGLIQNKKNRVGGREFHVTGWKCYTRKGKFKWLSPKAAEQEAKKARGEE